MATPTNLPAAFIAGQVLTSSQTNDLRGAFRVLQVFYAVTGVQVTSASTTFVDVGLSITITPQSATSKILIFNAQSCYASGGIADSDIRFLRGAGQVYISRTSVLATTTGGSFSNFYLDSPATTSPITYKVQGNRAFGTGSAVFQIANLAASSLLVAEISA